MKTIFCLLFTCLLVCGTVLPTQASCAPSQRSKQTAQYTNHWAIKFALKRVEKRQQRLAKKLEQAKTPKEVARIKQKQKITTFKVILLLVALAAILVGCVGLLVKSEGLSTWSFLVALVCLCVLFRGLFPFA